MKRGKMAAWAAVVASSAALPVMAATVTVNAPAGSVTNAFAFVSGEDSLAVNTGATGGVQQTAGVFVKTGAGTLTFTRPFDFSETTAVDTDGIRRKMLDLSPDRAPTQGYGNFTIVKVWEFESVIA